MDIFMRKVSYSVNDKQLTRKFTEILHGPDYREFRTSGAPFNFRVYLFNKRGQFGHKGCGLLNLHSEHVGRKFLRQYGGPFAIPFFIGGRRLEFKESDKPPRADVVHELNSLSYRDPDVVEAEERTKAEFSSGTVRVQAIQFGWECREPGVFSAEYEKTCPGRGYLRFQDEPREIRIKMDAADGMADTRIVAISSNQINYVSVGFVDSQPIIFFSLQRAPIYESEAPPMTTSLDELGLDFLFPQLFRPPPQRRRHSSFDEEHLATASYTSLAIRLVCSADRDLNTFRSLCRTASLHIHERPPRVELRGLFSAPVRIRFAAWLRALPWEVAYEVERITRRLSVDLVEMLSLRDEIARLNLDHIRMGALLREFGSEVRDLFYQNQNSEYVEGVAQCFLRCKKEFNQREIKPPRISRDQDDIFDCYHVLVTPSSYQLQGPFPERLNRVIRKYIEHSQCFIRVSFCDENQLMYRFDRDVNGAQFIKDRVRSSLNGLTIAGQDIEFLAYSQSALKEHSVWYIRPFFDLKAARIVNASRIIDDLGNFHNLVYDRAMSRCPARYAARISQSFTATDSSISTTVEEVFHIDDIERNGSCFTDGVGTISSLMADEICGALYNRARRRRRPLVKPRAFQVRFQGAKGMLSVDYRLKKREVYLRRSMIKFDAPDSNVIEIAQAFERPSRYYLNRPLIMLLEGVGVPYEVFEAYQDAAVRDAQNAMLSLNRTARLLEGHGLGTSFRIPSVLQHLEKIGVDAIPDPVFGRMQEFAVHHVLREMKHKARIPVPGGWILVGVADVHDYLEPRDIFACTQCPDCRKDIYFEGPTLVSRSPTIHPGDVQVLNAIGRPPAGSPFAHEPLKNCVVFSTKGITSLVLRNA
jgi:RNA-dependent RNA polymerase